MTTFAITSEEEPIPTNTQGIDIFNFKTTLQVNKVFLRYKSVWRQFGNWRTEFPATHLTSTSAWERKHHPSYQDIQQLYTTHEAVTSQDTWISHAFFGCAGAQNDLNVLGQSPIFDVVYDGKAPECPFEVNGVTNKHIYYLRDEIYIRNGQLSPNHFRILMTRNKKVYENAKIDT
ncbi:hypothetical protein OSB04_015020 [Centaurea solstitialis]|uniref:Uncharacterized protein n=1 Tax=Centaurea solstitialis TaxID=347529 RepID=A0AA38TA64_9ASTR|nr:hypothetical protein OSB04_015020 [Centaurea solstitialis]